MTNKAFPKISAGAARRAARNNALEEAARQAEWFGRTFWPTTGEVYARAIAAAIRALKEKEPS